MASNRLYQAHKAQASHNYDFVQSLSPAKPQFPDWVITGSFYMALHCVNAHAAKKGFKWKRYPKDSPFKISRHTQALRYIKKKLGMALFKDYFRLFQECWSARYDPFFLQRIHSSKPGRLFKLAVKLLKIV